MVLVGKSGLKRMHLLSSVGVAMGRHQGDVFCRFYLHKQLQLQGIGDLTMRVRVPPMPY